MIFRLIFKIFNHQRTKIKVKIPNISRNMEVLFCGQFNKLLLWLPVIPNLSLQRLSFKILCLSYIGYKWILFPCLHIFVKEKIPQSYTFLNFIQKLVGFFCFVLFFKIALMRSLEGKAGSSLVVSGNHYSDVCYGPHTAIGSPQLSSLTLLYIMQELSPKMSPSQETLYSQLPKQDNTTPPMWIIFWHEEREIKQSLLVIPLNNVYLNVL